MSYNHITSTSGIRGDGASSRLLTPPQIALLCGVPPIILLLIAGTFQNAEPMLIVAQLFLGVSAAYSLLLLRTLSTPNPIQITALLFYWWFGVAPAVISGYYALIENEAELRPYISADPVATWIVAAGLPVFAVTSRLLVAIWPQDACARFLRPRAAHYRPQTLLVFGVLGLGAAALIAIAGFLGFAAFEETNYLGGLRAKSTLIALISPMTTLGSFAVIGTLHLLIAGRRKRIEAVRNVITFALCSGLVIWALTSGSKGQIIIAGVWAMLIYAAWHQRIPWLTVLVVVAGYLVVVEPFVTVARYRAEAAGISTSAERRELFQEIFAAPELWFPRSAEDVNVTSPFRGTFLFASELAPRATWFSGPWQGQTIHQGLRALVPRFLDTSKPDMNMSNEFAASVGASPADDYRNNIAISIPFEFVVNFGWVAGVASFGFLALLCCSLTLYALGRNGLTTHPLMPLVATLLLAVESSTGQFMGRLRDLLFPLVCAWLWWWWRRGYI